MRQFRRVGIHLLTLRISHCVLWNFQVVLRLEEAYASSLKETASLVLEHTLNLGDQDTNNDIRDRARLLRQLVLSQSHPARWVRTGRVIPI